MNTKSSEKKQKFASSPTILFVLIFITIVFLVSSKVSTMKELQIINQKTNEKYFSTIIKESDVITYGWTHSLEHIPWTEEYVILKNSHLLLKKITIPAFGAGIPHNKGKVTKIENGTIIMDEINEEFNEISWIHSHSAMNYIKLNNNIIINGENLPHHETLKLKIEKRFRLWMK